jgi:hypothetical protein
MSACARRVRAELGDAGGRSGPAGEPVPVPWEGCGCSPGCPPGLGGWAGGRAGGLAGEDWGRTPVGRQGRRMWRERESPAVSGVGRVGNNAASCAHHAMHLKVCLLCHLSCHATPRHGRDMACELRHQSAVNPVPAAVPPPQLHRAVGQPVAPLGIRRACSGARCMHAMACIQRGAVEHRAKWRYAAVTASSSCARCLLSHPPATRQSRSWSHLTGPAEDAVGRPHCYQQRHFTAHVQPRSAAAQLD